MLNYGITTRSLKQHYCHLLENRDCNIAADGKLNTSNLKMVLGFY